MESNETIVSRVIEQQLIGDVVSRLEANCINNPPEVMPFLPLLFGGDRYHCVDEAVVLLVGGVKPVAIATIAPLGESGNGQPEIVGLYVIPNLRKHRIGQFLLQKTLERCAERSFPTVTICVITQAGKHLVQSFKKTNNTGVEINLVDCVSIF